jgi:hypothetical protein
MYSIVGSLILWPPSGSGRRSAESGEPDRFHENGVRGFITGIADDLAHLDAAAARPADEAIAAACVYG